MKVKVKFFNKRLLKDYFAKITAISVLVTILSVFCDIPSEWKLVSLGIFLLCLFIGYIISWNNANKMTEVKLNISGSTISVKVGDIFEEKENKVIAFNEYFDTQLENELISDVTLNGIYLKKYVQNIEELDSKIENSNHLKEKILECNVNRKYGKKTKYKLGTIYKEGDYYLTAFSKFDDENRAFLHMNDYINFLINFWNEIDILYGGKTVAIPLLGSGMTRFNEYASNYVPEQELLELLIWSFKISKIKFNYPEHIKIIIHETKKDKINFYKLKEFSNGL